jgi:uncharacterized cupin superfamily protein
MKKNSHWDIITGGTVHYTLLSPGVRDMEMIILEFPPGSSSSELTCAHAGMERGCLLRGELTVGIDDRVHVPHPGDSICFESRKRHHVANKGPGMAVARRR